MGDRLAPAEDRRVLDIVHQERRRVKHADNLVDDAQLRWVDVEPEVEGLDQLRADILAGVLG